MRMYSITLQHTHLHITLQYHAMDNLLDNFLQLSLPWTMETQVNNKFAQTNTILDAITYSEGTQYDFVKCYLLVQKISILIWSDNYNTDPDTSSIFIHLHSNQNKWTASDLTTIHTGYRTPLKERRIKIIKKKWLSSNLFWLIPNN